MGIPFQNGPISGEDVFVPIDAIIGGPDGAGQGWKMLMSSLATGRAISLPSVAAAGAKVSARATSAYALVREQFDTPIGRFEGVEEPLARIAALTYAIDAASRLTAAAIDAGEKPAVLSAIVKAYCTELMRDVVNDAMDIRAGAAIDARAAQHHRPHLRLDSDRDHGRGRQHPDALDDHLRPGRAALTPVRVRGALRGGSGGSRARSIARSSVTCASRWPRPRAPSCSGSRTAGSTRRAPDGALRRHVQRLGRASAAFALVSEAAMVTLGGRLKRREALTGRLADALAWLYLGSAVVKRFHDAGEPAGEQPFAQWSVEHALAEIEHALAGVLRNLPSRPVAWLLALLAFPLGRSERGPDDALGASVAETVLGDDAARESLTAGIFIPPPDEPGLGCLEAARTVAKPALAVEARLRQLVRDRSLPDARDDILARAAAAAGLITNTELALLTASEEARARAIEVDAFEPDEYRSLRR